MDSELQDRPMDGRIPINVPAKFESDDAVLDFTLDVRRTMVAEFTRGGLPINDKDQMVMLQETLRGLDSVAIGRKRIKVEEKSNADLNESRQAIAELLRQQAAHRQRGTLIEGETVPTAVIPVLDESIPRPTVVDGELEVGAKPMNYESFMQAQRAKD